MSFITNTLLSLHGWAALAIIFLLPALESSVFLGFVIPGETAVILGGVLAYEHRIPLWAAITVAILGAIIGDSIGYFVGREFGRKILDSKSARFIKPDHLRLAEEFIAKRGAFAVFLGRFAAALRAIIPGLAGMSGMRYLVFAIFNVLGGTAWAITFTLAGYLAGASFRTVQSTAGTIGYAIMGVIVLAVLGVILFKRFRDRRKAANVSSDATKTNAASPSTGDDSSSFGMPLSETLKIETD